MGVVFDAVHATGFADIDAESSPSPPDTQAKNGNNPSN
jgi:hypothetical protein